MYIIYRHQRNNCPFGNFGEKVGGGPWHTVIGTGALKLAKKKTDLNNKIIESINHADGECFPVFIDVFFFLPGNTNDVNAFLSETVQRKIMLARSLVLTQLTLAMFSEETIKFQRSGKQWYNLEIQNLYRLNKKTLKTFKESCLQKKRSRANSLGSWLYRQYPLTAAREPVQKINPAAFLFIFFNVPARHSLFPQMKQTFAHSPAARTKTFSLRVWADDFLNKTIFSGHWLRLQWNLAVVARAIQLCTVTYLHLTAMIMKHWRRHLS